MIARDFGLTEGMHPRKVPVGDFVRYVAGLLLVSGFYSLRSYSPTETFDPKVVIVGEPRRSRQYPSRQEAAFQRNRENFVGLLSRAATSSDILLSDRAEIVGENIFADFVGRVEKAEVVD